MKYLFTLSAAAAIVASCAPYPQGTNPINSTVDKLQSTTANLNTAATPAPPKITSLPTGRLTANGDPNLIISPYKPYNIIDVTGYKSGEVVGDPSTATVDPKTNKRIESTSKHFLIP